MAEDPAGLTEAERAYFTSRGETDIPAPPAPAEVAPEAPAPVTEALAPQPAEDADKEPPVQDLKADRPDRRVPLGELQEERKLRQAAEERVRQAELMQARMEERFKVYVDSAKPPPAPPQPPPRADQDIFGAVDHLSREINRRGQEIDGYKERLAAEDRQKQMDNWARAQEAEFARSNSDYMQALGYLRQGRAADLMALGVSGAGIEEQLKAEERQLMARAANLRKNPAELAYNLAQARGYRKTAAAPAPAPVDATQRLDAVEAGQRTSGSMAGVGGGAPKSADVTLSDLVKMSDAEFFAFKAKNPAKYRRLKGAEH